MPLWHWDPALDGRRARHQKPEHILQCTLNGDYRIHTQLSIEANLSIIKSTFKFARKYKNSVAWTQVNLVA